MPIYQYQCPQCESIFDKRQGFHDEAKAICPTCAYPDARRKISLPAIVFKGSGFYVTDTRSGNAAAAKPANANGKSDSNESSATESKSSTDSTSETKTSSESKPSTESKTTPEPKVTSKESK